MVIKKTKILLEFDYESLKELRKMLFRRGLGPQQFLTYIIEMAAINNVKILDLMDEAILYTRDNLNYKKSNKTNAELIYKLIEEKIKENN